MTISLQWSRRDQYHVKEWILHSILGCIYMMKRAEFHAKCASGHKNIGEKRSKGWGRGQWNSVRDREWVAIEEIVWEWWRDTTRI